MAQCLQCIPHSLKLFFHILLNQVKIVKFIQSGPFLIQLLSDLLDGAAILCLQIVNHIQTLFDLFKCLLIERKFIHISGDIVGYITQNRLRVKQLIPDSRQGLIVLRCLCHVFEGQADLLPVYGLICHRQAFHDLLRINQTAILNRQFLLLSFL